VHQSGYLDRWNVDEGRGEKDNGSRRVAEAMTRHRFEGSRQGARTRTTGADKDTRQGIELAGIVSVSPIPPFASGFTVNDCGHLTPHHVHAFGITGQRGLTNYSTNNPHKSDIKVFPWSL